MQIFKKGFDNGGNENSARKACCVLRYTQQQLNRRRKALVPKNQPKEAEFLYMLEEKLYIELLARPTRGGGLKHKFKPIIPASLPMRITA